MSSSRRPRAAVRALALGDFWTGRHGSVTSLGLNVMELTHSVGVQWELPGAVGAQWELPGLWRAETSLTSGVSLSIPARRWEFCPSGDLGSSNRPFP